MRPPEQFPTLDQWMEAVESTTELFQECAGETCPAAAALGKVHPERLHQAVEALLDARAFALWVASISESRKPPAGAISEANRQRCPTLSGTGNFFRLARCLDVEVRTTARREGWLSALRYQVIHHPRYHRLTHCCVHCQVERSRLAKRPVQEYSEWSRACDEYFVP